MVFAVALNSIMNMFLIDNFKYSQAWRLVILVSLIVAYVCLRLVDSNMHT